MTAYSKEQMIQRAFDRVAAVMYGMWEEKIKKYDTRLLNSLLIPDEYVLVGNSTNGDNYREHVIPRKVICDQCYEMFSKGSNPSEVSSFIRKHLKVVKISIDERNQLDRKDQLNLKQKMPHGWSFETGDVYERLKLAGINVEFVDQKSY